MTDATGKMETDGAPRPLCVLVVDDNKPFAETLAWVLRDLGHRVETCHNGFDALDVAKRFLPDVVLLDVVMPVMSGDETCRRLRAEKHPGMKVFRLTSFDDEPPGTAMARLFDGQLTKPVDLRRLVRTLEEARAGLRQPSLIGT